MKKLWMLMIWLCSLFVLWNSVQAQDYEYKNLDITAKILWDWTIDVEENYTANFFINKHGIIRNIPFNYSVDEHPFHIYIDNIDVKGYPFTVTNKGEEVSIKIGDANKTLIGENVYPISYTTYWLIRNFSWAGYAELYWNIVWYQFDTNINKVSAEIILPDTYTWFTSKDFLITTNGTTKTAEEFDWYIDWSRWDRVYIRYNNALPAYNGITFAMKLPNKMFEFDHQKQANLVWSISKYWDTTVSSWEIEKVLDSISKYFDTPWWQVAFFVVIILAFLLLLSPFVILSVLIIWWASKIWTGDKWVKKEYQEKYPVIIQYEPPKWLNSAEVWILLHRYCSPRDLFSLVYKWAAEWLIAFDKKDKKIPFIKLKDIPEDRPQYETRMFKRLFTDLEYLDKKAQFNFTFNSNDLVDYCVEEKNRCTRKTPSPSDGNIWVLLILIFIVPWLLLPISFAFSFIFFLTMMIMLLSKKFKPVEWRTLEETEEWAKLIAHILWYKKFLQACDEQQLRASLKEDPFYFDKVLPYAIVFGLDTKIIKKMSKIMKDLDIKLDRYDWDINSLLYYVSSVSDVPASSSSSSNNRSSYSSDSWFDSWSSFDSDSSFSSWWGGGWWGWSSW